MNNITNADKAEILKIFEVSLEDMDVVTFKKRKKELRGKYHPDNFEKFEDEIVKQMATERFQKIEDLSAKIEGYLSNTKNIHVQPESATETYQQEGALFAGTKLKIEIITTEKDLKYHLFGTKYRWLVYGEEFKIPNTNGKIIIDDDHKGRQIGFVETIKMYVTFSEFDAVEDIVDWLFGKIEGKAKSLIIAGKTVDVERRAIEDAIKQKTFLRLGTGD